MDEHAIWEKRYVHAIIFGAWFRQILKQVSPATDTELATNK